MTNYEYIKSLPIEKLAKIILMEEQYDDMILYITPNGEKFMSRDDAIDETIEWLNSKRNGKSYLETCFSL
ncbi:MAG TPA: hypothetical protein OIL92_03610 [Oscillospiraceae bacterium]|nr:hypothetical protein [Oscillospiraceae bacterium]